MYFGILAEKFLQELTVRQMSNFNYSTNFQNAVFPNPIFTASGCAGSGKELAQFFPLGRLVR